MRRLPEASRPATWFFLALWFAGGLALVCPPPALAQAAPAGQRGAATLQILNRAPLRIEPLTPADYARGYSESLVVDFKIHDCRTSIAPPMPGACTLEILGILPFDGILLKDIQWATRPAGPWTDLTPVPARVLSVPAGARAFIGRLYLRTRISYASAPARLADARSLVRLRLVY